MVWDEDELPEPQRKEPWWKLTRASVWAKLNSIPTTRGWYPALEAAGLPKIRFHQARHAYASTLIAALLPVTTVSKVLGHADSTITLRVYAHCFDRVTSHEAVREAMTAALG